MKIRTLLAASCLAAATSFAHAASYFEDFEADFPAWESGWLGLNSDLLNYYGVGGGRGNNPDGLWVGASITTFGSGLGTITTLSFDVATWINGSVNFYDASHNLLSSQALTANFGAYSDPGTYEHFTWTSAGGIKSFEIVSDGLIVGNTSIDNVSVNAISAVPEAETYAMLLSGLGLLGAAARRRKQT